MDIKTDLREVISQGADFGLTDPWRPALCQRALAEINRLEFNISAIKGAARSALLNGNAQAGYYTQVLQDIVSADIRDG